MLLFLPLLTCTLIWTVTAPNGDNSGDGPGPDVNVHPSSRSIFRKKEKKKDEMSGIEDVSVDVFLHRLETSFRHPYLLAMIHPGTWEPDCGKCADAWMTLGRASKNLKSHYPPVDTIRVWTGEREAEIKKRWGLKDLPFLLLFNHGTPRYYFEQYPYRGDPPDIVTAWVQEETAGGALHITDFKNFQSGKKPGDQHDRTQSDELSNYLDTGDPLSTKTKRLNPEYILETSMFTLRHDCIVIGMFDKEVHKVFRKLAMKGDTSCMFGYTYNRMVPRKHMVKVPAVALSYVGPSGQKVAAIYNGDMDNYEDLAYFVRCYRLPIVWRVEGVERLPFLYADGRPALMLFCDVDKCEKERMILKQAAMKLQRRLLGVFIDTKLKWASQLMNKVSLEIKETPKLLIAEELTEQGASRVHKFDGDLLKKAEIVDFAKDFMKDNMPETAKNDL